MTADTKSDRVSEWVENIANEGCKIIHKLRLGDEVLHRVVQHLFGVNIPPIDWSALTFRDVRTVVGSVPPPPESFNLYQLLYVYGGSKSGKDVGLDQFVRLFLKLNLEENREFTPLYCIFDGLTVIFLPADWKERFFPNEMIYNIALCGVRIVRPPPQQEIIYSGDRENRPSRLILDINRRNTFAHYLLGPQITRTNFYAFPNHHVITTTDGRQFNPFIGRCP